MNQDYKRKDRHSYGCMSSLLTVQFNEKCFGHLDCAIQVIINSAHCTAQ